MATSVFTTWQALYESMLDALASDNHRVYEARLGSTVIKYKNDKDFMDKLKYVETRAGLESGSISLTVKAKNVRL